MPIYEYRCAKCGFQKEFLQRLERCAAHQVSRNAARRRLKKMVTAAGFQLKGTGWYATDFKNSGEQGEDQGERRTKDPPRNPRPRNPPAKESSAKESSAKESTTKESVQQGFQDQGVVQVRVEQRRHGFPGRQLAFAAEASNEEELSSSATSSRGC